MGRRFITISFVIGLLSCTSSKPQQSSPLQAAAKPALQSKASAESLSKQTQLEPEIVRVEKVVVGPRVKVVLVGNKNGQYSLSCNAGADGCRTPKPGVDYYVVTKETRWTLQGAQDPMTLKFIQDWTGTYNNAENIGLIAVDVNQREGLCLYWLNLWTGR
jgi:hypothetical protein